MVAEIYVRPRPSLAMKSFSYLLMMLWLSGCAVWGPDYEHPSTDAPKGWHTQDPYALGGATKLPEMAWWNKFSDPLLGQLVDRALERNNTVQSALGNVFKAKAILQQIEMNWVPTITAGAGYISTEQELNNTTLSSLPFPGFTAGFIPNYSINILQQLRTQEQAQANIDASIAAKNAVRLAIISQMVGTYFTLREEEYRLDLQKKLVTALSEIVTAFETGYREGLISLYVLQQYKMNLANAKAEVPVIEYNIVNLGNTIHVLLNENPGAIAPGKSFMDFEDKGIVSGNIPSTVLRNRPDVIQAEAVLKQSNANIGINTSVFFPTVRLTTPLGLASSTVSNVYNQKDSYFQYQGGFSMPVINLGAFGAIKSAKGQYYADYYAYVEVVRKAFASVDSDFSAHQKYTDSLTQMLGFYDATRNKYEYQTTRFREGLVAAPDVLTLRATLNEAGIQVARTKLNQLLSIVRLYQDMGGGYLYKDNEDAHDLGEGRRFGDLF